MLTLSAASIIEKNKIWQQSAWLTMLEIQDNRLPEYLRIVCSNKNVIWGGHEWVAFPFEISSVKQTKSEVPKVPVKISNITRAIEQYIEMFDGFIGDTVILRVINTAGATLYDDVYTVTTDAVVEETFVVQSVSSDAMWATFNLGGSLPIMQRFPARRILKDFCPFVYKGIECAATSNEVACPKTLVACRARNNSTRFGGEPAIGYGGIYASNT